MLKSVANCILLRYNQTIKRNRRRIIMEEKQNAKATEKVEKKVADKKPTKKQGAPKKDTNKKFEKIKGEIKKIDNRIIIGVAVAVVVLIAILACVFLMSDSPKKSVESMLSDLKAGDYSRQAVLSELLEEDEFNEEAKKLFFDKLGWKVLNVKQEGDTANVEVEITNKDFKTIISNYMQKAFKLALTGQNVGEEQITNYLIEELKNDEIQTVTANQTIKVEKKDGKWEIAEDNDFANILLPGFNEAVSAFN